MQGGRCCFLPLRNKHGGGRRSGDLKGGWLGFGLADGDSVAAEGSRAERIYEQNGKKCGQKRKDVSGSRGGVIHWLGWACSTQLGTI